MIDPNVFAMRLGGLTARETVRQCTTVRVGLTGSETRLIRLFVAAVVGDASQVAAVCAAAGPVEADVRWREALLQVHLFAGFPRMIEAFETVRRARGWDAGLPEEPKACDERQTCDERQAPDDGAEAGDALFDRIYADAAPVVRDRLSALHPELGRWVKAHAYGRVLCRPGLEPRLRELLAVAALAVTGPDRQLASHTRGAVRCGAQPTEVLEAVRIVEDFIDGARYATVQTVIRRFVSRKATRLGG